MNSEIFQPDMTSGVGSTDGSQNIVDILVETWISMLRNFLIRMILVTPRSTSINQAQFMKEIQNFMFYR